MPKRKFPSVVRAMEGKSTRHKNFGKGDFRFALIEENEKSYFAVWSFSDGYLVLPFDTQLEAVMLYQMVVEELKKAAQQLELYKIVEMAGFQEVHSYLALSWDWIQNRIKNGEKTVQSLQNVDAVDKIFGTFIGKKIKDFIK